MEYYLCIIDFYVEETGKTFIEGELITHIEAIKEKLTRFDLSLYFVKVVTPKQNTIKMFGVRKVKKYKYVDIVESGVKNRCVIPM